MSAKKADGQAKEVKVEEKTADIVIYPDEESVTEENPTFPSDDLLPDDQLRKDTEDAEKKKSEDKEKVVEKETSKDDKEKKTDDSATAGKEDTEKLESEKEVDEKTSKDEDKSDKTDKKKKRYTDLSDDEKFEYSEKVKNRVDALVRERETIRREKEKEIETLKRRYEELKKKIPEEEITGESIIEQVIKANVGSKPDIDKYNEVDEYEVAYQKWLASGLTPAIQEKIKTEMSKVKPAEIQDTEADKYQKIVTDKLEIGRKKYSDFDDVTQSALLTQTMITILSETENLAEVVYYLGKNFGEADKISKMGIIEAASEIQKLDNNFSEPKKENLVSDDTDKNKPNPPQKSVSDASDIIKPVTGVGESEKDPDNMSASEYKKWRKAGGGT